MRIIYPLTAALALASAASIPPSQVRGEVAVRGSAYVDAISEGSVDSGLAGRFTRLLKRLLQKPSEITAMPEYGPPPKKEIPSSAYKPGDGWDKLTPEYRKYVEDILDKEPTAEQVKMPMNWLDKGKEAKAGETAMMQDEDGHFHIWYGDDDETGRMRFHAMSKAYSMAANGIDSTKQGLTLRYKFPRDPDEDDGPSRDDVFAGAPHPRRDDKTAPVLEEAPMNMLQRKGFHVTLTLAPDGESKQEGNMASSLQSKAKKQQDAWNDEYDASVAQAEKDGKPIPSEDTRKRVQVTYYDNRTQKVRDEMNQMLREGKLKLYRGPVVKDWPAKDDVILPMLYYGVKGISPDRYWNEDAESDAETDKSGDVIALDMPVARLRPGPPSRGPSGQSPPPKKKKTGFVDVKGDSTQDGSSQNSQKRGILHRRRFASPPFVFTRNVVDGIKNDTNNKNDTTKVAKQEYDDLNLGYTATRNNISTLIWPIIQDLMESSDSLTIHDMALSIWAQLTRAPVTVGGPYYFGSTNFYDLEQQANQDSEFSDADKQETTYMINKLNFIYQQTWANASAAANQYGGLDLLDRIANRLQPADATIIPPEDSNPDDTAVNIFGAFNPPANSTITLSQWEQLWADAGDANGTSVANGTDSSGNSTSAPFANGTSYDNSTMNSTMMRRFRRARAVVLPTYQQHIH